MSIFSLLTNDDWTAAQLTVDFGGPPQVFTPAANENSAYAALQAFLAWIAATFPGESMTWTWAQDATTSGASITMTMSNNATIVANAAAQSLTGLAASTGPTTIFASVWAGTWHPSSQLDLTRWVRWLRGDGPASGVGALRRGVPGAAARAPLLRVTATALDIARLMFIIADAARPRQAWIYQVHTETWRQVSLGKIAPSSRVGPLLNELSIEVLG